MFDFKHILILTLGQGIILAFFLLTSKYYKNVANTWLAAALILLSTNSIFDILGSEYVPGSLVVEFFLNDIELGFLLYVPLYYFFKIYTSSSPKRKYFNPYLLLPFLIDTLINLGIVSAVPIEAIGTHSGVQLFYEIESFLAIAFNLFLCYKSYHLIKTYGGNSNRKRWLKSIWQSTAILLIVFTLVIFSSYLAESILNISILTLYILISIWMFWMIYNGIVNLKLMDDRKNISLKLKNKTSQSKSISYRIAEPAVVSKETNNKPKNNLTSNSNPRLFSEHFHKIKELLVAEALYRNEDLSIDDIAQQIDMSTGYVSKIIKKTANKNFPSWINEFRVEEVKSMFVDADFDHYTTLSIGLEAGFKSKSAFYATFKKIMGETPAKFRKKKS